MRQNKKIIFVLVFLVLFVVTGCNIFEFLHRPKGDTEEHVAQGQKHLNDRNYAAALSEFEDAMVGNPTNSDARYGYAKAYARLYLKKDFLHNHE